MFFSNKSCQSCGLPWNKDPENGGTEADESKSDVYCSYCYKVGEFVQPDWAATEMQAYVLNVLCQKGIPEMMAKIMVKEIPKLARWQ